MAVTPTGGNASAIGGVGSQPVVAVLAGPNGGFIYNPSTGAEQGLANPEPLYVDSVGGCLPVGGVLGSGGTIVRVEPGGTYNLIPGQTTPTWVNAVSAGHKFAVVSW